MPLRRKKRSVRGKSSHVAAGFMEWPWHQSSELLRLSVRGTHVSWMWPPACGWSGLLCGYVSPDDNRCMGFPHGFPQARAFTSLHLWLHLLFDYFLFVRSLSGNLDASFNGYLCEKHKLAMIVAKGKTSVSCSRIKGHYISKNGLISI